MEPDKVLKLLTEHVSDWWQTTCLTLLRPISRFELVPAAPASSVASIHGVDAEQRQWLDPKLLVFAVVSIVLGLSLNALLPKRVVGPQLLPSVLVVFLFWALCGSALYLLCRLLGGTGTYLQTLTITLQVSATLYVTASFLSLLAVPLVLLRTDNVLGVQLPVALFFLISTVLTAIYIPLGMKRLHRFGWGRTALLSAVTVLSSWMPVSIYLTFGVLTSAALSAQL
jgi:hypothetical protein